MTDEEKIARIEEIKANFMRDLRAIEQERDEKIKVIKKGIDQQKIEAILSDLKS
jgi:hypothetical protein